MNGKYLIGSVLVTAAALSPVAMATQASAAATGKTVISAPQDAYVTGHRQGYARGMRDGRLDCRHGRRHTRMHFSPPRMGTTRFSRGYAIGYRAGYSRMCG